MLKEVCSEIGFSRRELSAKTFTCFFWSYEVSQSAVQWNRELNDYHISGIGHCSLSF